MIIAYNYCYDIYSFIFSCHRAEAKVKSVCGHIFCCKVCKKVVSPIAGTFFERRKLPLEFIFICWVSHKKVLPLSFI